MLNRLLVLMLALSFWGGPVIAAPPDIPTVHGIPGLFFTDKLLRQYFPVATDTPLPTEMFGTGSVKIVESGASAGNTGAYVAGPSVGSITVSANAKDFSVVNLGTETLWLGFSGGATVSAGIPVYSETMVGRDAKAGFVIWYIASSTVPFTYEEGQK